MASKNKPKDEQIREAAAEGRIQLAEQDAIDDYPEIAREFLSVICKLNLDECLITDESALSDFAGCCVPPGFQAKALGRNEKWAEFYQAGKENMVRLIQEHYHLTVDPHDYLVVVFEKIRQSLTATENKH